MGLTRGLCATCDRKTKFYPTQRNAFGILPGPEAVGGTCPWATRGCGGCFHVPEGRKRPDCYAYAVLQAYGSARSSVEANTEALRGAGSAEEMADMLSVMLDEFERSTLSYARKFPDKAGKTPLAFRWHWSGDLFSEDYARALSIAMARHPGVRFWTYTRSFNHARFLRGSNLVVYFSVDDDNWEQGVSWYFRLGFHRDPNRRIAYMAKDKGSVLNLLSSVASDPGKYFPDAPAEAGKWAGETKVSSCPVDLGNMGTDFACSKCGQCIWNGGQLLFFKC